MILSTATRSILRQQARQTFLKAATARAFSCLSQPSHLASPRRSNDHSFQARFQSSAVQKPKVDTSGRDAYNVSQEYEGTDACRKVGIDRLGITGPTKIYRNLTYQEIFDHEVKNNEGEIAKAEYGDTFLVKTGKYTGRSPKDRWIVQNPGSVTDQYMDWNDINQPTTPEVFDELYDKAVDYFNTRQTAYVFDGYCGANKATQKKVRFVETRNY